MSKKRAGTAERATDRRIVAQNRRARHDYEILDRFEAGLALVGSEVKSLRDGKCQLKDSYARIENGEAWLFGVHIPPSAFATGFGSHHPARHPKHLLQYRRIDKPRRRHRHES